MTEVAAVVDRYIAVWNETDPDRRRALIARTWTEDGSYVDPHAESSGPEAIDAMVAAVQEQFAGHEFRLVAGPDAHHDRVRFTWQLFPENGGAPLATGIDFATLAPDGRLREVAGFLEPAAA